MWEIDNTTPFPHVGSFLKDAQGQSSWIVGVKTTFALRPNEPCLFVPKQIAPFQGPIFVAEDPEQDLLADTDICLPKNMVDVIIDASAYPPAGTAADQPYRVSAKVGSMHKTIEVAPVKNLGRWGKLQSAKDTSHTPIPLRYSQSYGGHQTDENPIGIGDANTLKEGFPRLSLPDQPMTRPGQAIASVGLNPIPRHWPARKALGGTYDKEWQRRRAPILPADLKPAYWQSVPADQQIKREEAQSVDVVLTNMQSADGTSADAPISFRLPRVKLAIATRFKGQWQQTPPELQTIHIFAETGLLSLFFLAKLPIQAAQNDVFIEKTVISLERGSDFRVRAQDASLFDSSLAEQEVN